MRCFTPRNQISLFIGTYSIVPLPIFTHCQQNEALWVSKIDKFGSHWSFGEDRRARGHQFPTHNWNHTSLFEDHGVRIRTLQNCGNFHFAKDIAGWDWLVLYLPDVWQVLSCGYDFGKLTQIELIFQIKISELFSIFNTIFAGQDGYLTC